MPGRSGAGPVLPEAAEGEDSDGTEELVAAFFQSRFDLSFSGRPHWFVPDLAYRPAVALACGYRLIPDPPPWTPEPPLTEDGVGGGADPRGPAFPSGRIARGQPQLAARRLDASLLARLYYASMMAEIAVMPLYIARDPADKDRQRRRIAHIIGLDHAVLVGLIDGYDVCWPAGRYPKTAHSVRLRVPGGRRQRERVLGQLGSDLRQWVELLKGVSGMG